MFSECVAVSMNATELRTELKLFVTTIFFFPRERILMFLRGATKYLKSNEKKDSSPFQHFTGWDYVLIVSSSFGAVGARGIYGGCLVYK